MNSRKEKTNKRNYLIFAALFFLLGIAAVVFAPGNYWLYTNFLIGAGYVAAYFYD
ncbi:hypothetical protein [Neolewinella aurantiaca]|uniref:hypothetical protein n=1 Tax=Neolewinella aurantiaca TaxID=2602767 RepID=UPI001650097C|nr:hypothetical protein [Neolewinella aurantiaca]